MSEIPFADNAAPPWTEAEEIDLAKLIWRSVTAYTIRDFESVEPDTQADFRGAARSVLFSGYRQMDVPPSQETLLLRDALSSARAALRRLADGIALRDASPYRVQDRLNDLAAEITAILKDSLQIERTREDQS